MGLDMYLTGERCLMTPRTGGGSVVTETYDLGYWRKHPNLHGFIVTAFAGGEDDCQPIHLTTEQLRRIRTAVDRWELPATAGFFFGESDGSERPYDLTVLDAAIAWLAVKEPDAVRSVYYRASW
jgi:hypothetical protein